MLRELFVDWPGGPQITIERKHFQKAIAHDDAYVVVKSFSKPQITVHFYRR